MIDLDAIRSGGKRAMAEALAKIEAEPDSAATAALLDQAFAAPKGAALGLTGPPGVGKSTLMDALIKAWRATGTTVGVIAVDPSSARSGGALLGDRTRLSTDPSDQGVFVRSMAARDRLGGVAGLTFPAAVLMRALYDIVLIETVGIGQSETEIANIADLVVFCAQPGSGDALQYMKAGIMEVPDLVLVTKADMGQAARRTEQDLKGALSLNSNGRTPTVIRVSATNGTGLDTVLQEICTILATLSPRFGERRGTQLDWWERMQIRSRFGSVGVGAFQPQGESASKALGFREFQSVVARLNTAITEAFR